MISQIQDFEGFTVYWGKLSRWWAFNCHDAVLLNKMLAGKMNKEEYQKAVAILKYWTDVVLEPEEKEEWLGCFSLPQVEQTPPAKVMREEVEGVDLDLSGDD